MVHLDPKHFPLTRDDGSVELLSPDEFARLLDQNREAAFQHLRVKRPPPRLVFETIEKDGAKVETARLAP